MANPLACAVASRSIELLLENDWHRQVSNIQGSLKKALSPAASHPMVQNVRVLGGIGVVEMKERVDLNIVQPEFVRQGIWLRPFGKLIYSIPPYISSKENIQKLGEGIINTIDRVYS